MVSKPDPTKVLDPARIQALRDAALLDTPAEPAFDRLAELLRRTTASPIGLVSLVDSERQYFKSSLGLPEPLATTRQAAPALSLCKHVVATGVPLVIDDTTTHALTEKDQAVLGLGIRAYLGAPLITPAGHTLGTLCAIDVVPRRWTGTEIEAANTLAASVVSEITLRAHLRDQVDVQASARRGNLALNFLAQFASNLLVSPDPQQLVAQIYDQTANFLGADLYFNYTFDTAAPPDLAPLYLTHTRGLPACEQGNVSRLELGQGLCGHVAATRAPLYLPRLQTSENPLAQHARGVGVHVYAAEPLLVGDRLIGTLAFASRTRDAYSDDELALIRTVANYVASADERIQRESSILQSKARFGIALDAASMGSWHVDLTARVVRTDANLNRIVGLPPVEGSEPLDDCFDSVHPDDRDLVRAAWNKTLSTRGQYEAEYRYYHDDSRVQWLREQGHFVPGARGQSDSVTGVTLDITQRKQAETELKLAKDAAESANSAKDRFLAVLSHELRTPLNPVLLTLTSLELDQGLPASLRDDLTMIRRNVELETKLIDDLLDLSRISTGKLRLSKAPFDFADAVRDVCSICRSQILEKGIRLRVNLDRVAATVNADPARIRQAMWNIVKNATKFTPDHGDIRVSTTVENGRVAFRVTDSGPGISPELMPRIFDAFEQGDSPASREFGGLGLGLAISRAIIELHGGTIRAESTRPGTPDDQTGSSFIIELPTVAAAAPRPETRIEPPTSATVGPLRLLVVEDHADTARVLARLLRTSGYAVKTAGSVADALEIAAAEKFDVLVSDIGLPDATGYELMKRLRNQYALKGIAMSGYGMEDDLRKSAEAGFAEHLVKPVNIAQLEQSIRRVAVE